MKIGIISDIHSNIEALEQVIKFMEKENVDKIICLGDIIGIGPKSKETLQLILNSNIDIVLGNHDLYYTKGLEIDDNITMYMLEQKKKYKRV